MKTLFYGSAAVALAVAPQPALAQQAGAGAQASAIETVVVTAQRREALTFSYAQAFFNRPSVIGLQLERKF